MMEEIIKSYIIYFGPDSDIVIETRLDFSTLLTINGIETDLIEAKRQLEIAIDMDIAKFGANAESFVSGRFNLAKIYYKLGGIENLKWTKSLLRLALEDMKYGVTKDSFLLKPEILELYNRIEPNIKYGSIMSKLIELKQNKN